MRGLDRGGFLGRSTGLVSRLGRIRRVPGLDLHVSVSGCVGGMEGLTASCLNNPFQLLGRIKRRQIKHFNHRSRLMQFRRIIRRRGKLLEHLPPNPRRRLLHPHNGTIPEITLHKENHLFVSHQHVVAADDVQPSLDGGFDAGFIFVGPDAGGGLRWGNCRDQGFGVGRDEVFGKFDEFTVCAADVAELGGAEFGEIGLPYISVRGCR
jgi:hypothetical protein